MSQVGDWFLAEHTSPFWKNGLVVLSLMIVFSQILGVGFLLPPEPHGIYDRLDLVVH